ncbi:hypothetical protein Caci_7324 [Catenulispora acidiphila DSM 44928]|uniref:Uncharacterized protein n=1 Tax=Catenulispora acidiphila (strain DSM 44928 / JCM 14897 / NBRC 102108 / NRRL B-24433 / ID139908) TaxID=479433 RepID=C7Q8G5_CATAD|nr:hypothetical protein [Catenulispora acidiphila]ACU76153.1 hypothetical protein Caci_7324 [Catenulispora acidiphila DSM 44928]
MPNIVITEDSDWRKRFRALHQKEGAWREGFYTILGSELCQLWEITESMTPEEVCKQFSTALDLLLPSCPYPAKSNTYPDPEEAVQRSLRVTYNTANVPKLRDYDLPERRHWLEHDVPEAFRITESSSEGWLRTAQKTFLPLIEKELIAKGIILKTSGVEPSDEPQVGVEVEQAVGTPKVAESTAADETISTIAVADPATDDATESKAKPGRRHRKLVLAPAAVAIGLAVYAALPDTSPSTRGQSTPSFGATTVADPNGNPVGSMLGLTVTGVGSLDSTSFVFPASDTSQAHGVVSQINAFGYPNIAQELSAGAYNYGNTLISLKIDDNVPSPVAIYNIRVVSRQVVPTPSGLFVVEPASEPSTDQAAFDLDATTPKPQYYASGAFQGDFFDRAFGVDPQDGHTLNIFLKASKASYTYQLAIDYEVVGRRYTQMIPGSFQTAASLCDRANGSPYTDIYQWGTDSNPQGFTSVSATSVCS